MIGDKNAAEAKLRSILAERTAGSEKVIANIQERAINDAIAAGKALSFDVPNPEESRELVVHVGNQFAAPLHPHARDQAIEKAGVDRRYAGRLMEGDPWQRDLLQHILNTTYQNSDHRYLVRRANGEVRGLLSDKFRRIDSRPLLEAVVDGLRTVGAIPYGGTVTDTRITLRAVTNDVIEIVPGEFVVLGAEWSNSEFGDGKNSLRAFLERLWCLNGATTQDVFSQVHLGGKLPDDIVFSNETYQLDHETTRSATKDALVAVFSPEKRQQLVERIRASVNQGLKIEQVRGKLAKLLTKDELKRVVDAFEGPDVVNLPAGENAWRASNALSWVAQSKDVPAARRLELEKFAGQVIEGTLGTVEESTDLAA